MIDFSRQKKEVPEFRLQKVKSLYDSDIVSIDDAVKRSGLGSKRTFYRRLKKLNKDKPN